MYIFTTNLDLRIEQPYNDSFLADLYKEGLIAQFDAENIWFKILISNVQQGIYKFKIYYPSFFNDSSLILQVINDSIFELNEQIPFQSIVSSKPRCIRISKEVFEQKIKQFGFKTKMERYFATLN